MYRWQKTFFQLLRSGLWERQVEDLSVFSLTKEEWWLVYNESVRQTVQGLCYMGLQYLPDECYPPQEVVSKWMSSAIAVKEKNAKVCSVTAAIYKMLTKGGVTPVLMKGQAVGQYYEKPPLRVCGDIDLYIADNHQFDTACDLLSLNKMPYHISADGSACFYDNEVEVELHHQLVDVQRPRSIRYVSSLLEDETFGVMQLTYDVAIKVPSPMVTLLMLNAHIMKHVFTVGVGLRQFCDMARAYHTLDKQYDHEKLASIIQDLGLGKWTALLHGLLTEYLGLPIGDLPYQSDAVNSINLLQKVLAWGNFGQQTVSWNKAADSSWKMKLHTVKRITSGMPYSLRLAPIETIYIIKNLIKGQLINSKNE